MTLLRTHPLNSSEVLAALCGPDEVYGAQLVLLASMWRDDLDGFDKTKLRARHFADERLRKVVAFVIGSSATFGLNDTETVQRLLVDYCDISEQWVDVTFNTIERIADVLTEPDVDHAWEVVST